MRAQRPAWNPVTAPLAEIACSSATRARSRASPRSLAMRDARASRSRAKRSGNDASRSA